MYEIHVLTVAELIEQLKKCPQNAQVFFESHGEWPATKCETRTWGNEHSVVYITTD